MNHPELWSRIDAIIARHDLLQHPFYQAWTAGTLRREDLKRYAQEHYHHVAAFPVCLSTLHSRLPDGSLRRSVLRNLCEEEITGTAHSDLWLDFAEGMGATADEVRQTAPSNSTQSLMDTFRRIAGESAPVAGLGAFYAYESQVARIAPLKASGLRDKYGANAKTTAYFTQHATQDVHHARVWSEQIDRNINDSSCTEQEILAAVEEAATALWKSLDGIHEACGMTCPA